VTFALGELGYHSTVVLRGQTSCPDNPESPKSSDFGRQHPYWTLAFFMVAPYLVQGMLSWTLSKVEIDEPPEAIGLPVIVLKFFRLCEISGYQVA